MDLMDIIRRLSDIPGVSGREELVREEIISLIKEHCEYQVDRLGNLTAFKKGTKPTERPLLFCAHMDEVGYIVTYVEESGLLRFTTVGGIDSRVAVGRGVEIGDKRIYGVIGTKAVHHQKESEKEEALPFDKLYIDIGAASKEEALKLVKPGDRAIFHSSFRKMGRDKILGRALDDRAGCALLVDLIRQDLPYDCHFAFTVQEEIGCIGAVAAGYTVHPSAAIVVETTTASDIPGTDPSKVVCSFGKGPVLSFMDRGAIYNFDLFNKAKELAWEKGINCQVKEGAFGGNDSRSLMTAHEGAKILAVSMPCRYLHTPSNMLQESDIHDTLKLLEALAGIAGDLV